MEFSVRPPSPPNTYFYVQEENLDSTRILFRKSKKVLEILRNDRVCMVVDPYKERKRYTVTESLDIIVSVK